MHAQSAAFDVLFRRVLMVACMLILVACTSDDDDDPPPSKGIPDTTILSAPPVIGNSANVQFSFESDKAGAEFQCSLDGSDYTPCSSPASYTGLSDADHSFSVRAQLDGETDETPATHQFTIDTIAPISTLNAVPSDPTALADVDFEFSADEANVVFECSLDAADFSTCASPIEYTGLSHGSHNFRIRATDAAGNTESTPVQHDWQVDLMAPDTVFSYTPLDPSNLSTARFEFSAQETVAFYCSLDSATLTPCSSPLDLNGLSEGQHDFIVEARDLAGNVDPSPASHSWIVDLTAPVTVVDNGPADPINSDAAELHFSANETSSYQCSLDGAIRSDCSSPMAYNGLGEEDHVFSVWATDTAGNLDPNGASHTWRVDLTAPDTLINSMPTNPSSLDSADFAFGASESNVSFQCAIDGAALSACVSPISYTALAVGSHSFTVQATDAAGNTDPTPATYQWQIVVDSGAPTGSISLNNNAQYAITVNSLAVNLSATDDGGVVAYLLTEHNVSDPGNVTPPYADPLVSDERWVTVVTSAAFEATIQTPLTQVYNKGDTVAVCVWYKDQQDNISTRVCDQIIVGGGWESGWGNWYADNGVWQVGTPTVSPAGCFSGVQCAGTILDANYPAFTNSRLISPAIHLGSPAANEKLTLRFRHWFSYGGYDSGQVQVSVWDSTASSWGVWVDEGIPVVDNSDWTLKAVDLSAYAGQIIRLGFNHTATRCNFCGASEGPGWFIDDIEIVSKVPEFSGDFEPGIADWSADRGVWQIGTPTAGPTNCFTGTQCAGTILSGSYPAYTDSRLISAEFTLPTPIAGQELHLRFRHWFSYGGYDSGQVQISVWDAAASAWGAWQNEGIPVVDNSDWSLKDVDLSAYAGQTVRLAFYHVATRCNFCGASEGPGWFIDDVEIVTKAPEFSGDFEVGIGDWSADRGVWQLGAPTAGTTLCYTGSQCFATILGGNYPAYTDSRLISAAFSLPSVAAAEELHLRFRHWFSYGGYDSGQVQLSAWDSNTAAWGDWANVGIAVVDNSDWSLKDIEISEYAGQTVRLAFYHTATRCNFCGASEGSGWVIDDIELVAKIPEFNGDFEMGIGDWGADRGVWQIGVPTSGPAACFSGQCAATVLGGNYPAYTDSRLVSATFQLPVVTGFEELHLRFQHWFSYGGYDSGQVQISVWDDVNGTWGAWENVGIADVNASGAWTQKDVILTPYANQVVRIAFYHIATRCNFCGASESSGWYIDNVEVVNF